MPCPLLIFNQSEYSIWIVAINSNTEANSADPEKPTDLVLHCLQKRVQQEKGKCSMGGTNI